MIIRCNREILLNFDATKAAEIANKLDLIKIIGNTKTGGIPNRKLFINGDKIAVAKPTVKPNL